MTRARALAACFLGLVPLVACGGGETSDSGDTTAQEVQVLALDFRFQPDELTLTSARDVELTFVNQGKTEHSFTIEEPAIEVEADGGMTEVINFEAPTDGEFGFYCKYHPDQMTGTLTIGE